MNKLAWIGTGHMGLPMARNLLKAGYSVHVYNRTAEKVAPLQQEGATLAATASEAVADTDTVFIMLTKGDAVKAVLEGEHGILKQIREGACIINMSTISPDEARTFAAMAAEVGAIYVDAPVSGTVAPAEQGQLVILAGGSADAVERCQPYFDILGKHTIHFGEVGAGSSAKLSINLMLGVTMQGIAEALVIGEHAGLQREQLLEMIGQSAVATPMLNAKQKMLLQEEFPSAFMISLLSKDLGLLMDEARRDGIDLPLAAAADRTFADAKEHGKGEMDMAAIWLELQERNFKNKSHSDKQNN
ncbi:NAD(P)-dependent oxidoreductase [Paenibacillus hunanensis]|uniref:NAD(P)-dependent oxidoreductase n=1 Tax=Paenibacillus hunanensis TaxID=539262 RepID=UPI0020265BE1|nr:NAD(P)-dependent oxidoreductase [Paenibacillus hunanensis]MCL9660912.1 NAD(P)-dependent oxidoreductase [Paenibacillus hunanensis]